MSTHTELTEQQRKRLQYQQLSDETNIDLSMTLVERRRRLHELADEINQWQDESTNTQATKK